MEQARRRAPGQWRLLPSPPPPPPPPPSPLVPTCSSVAPGAGVCGGGPAHAARVLRRLPRPRAPQPPLQGPLISPPSLSTSRLSTATDTSAAYHPSHVRCLPPQAQRDAASQARDIERRHRDELASMALTLARVEAQKKKEVEQLTRELQARLPRPRPTPSLGLARSRPTSHALARSRPTSADLGRSPGSDPQAARGRHARPPLHPTRRGHFCGHARQGGRQGAPCAELPRSPPISADLR